MVVETCLFVHVLFLLETVSSSTNNPVDVRGCFGFYL